MKAIFKKLYNKLVFYDKYTAFLTIDNNYISGAVYKNEYNLPKTLVITANSVVKGVNREDIISSTLFAHSIAECIDKLEEECKYRIKNVIVTLIGFNSRSIKYLLCLKQNKNINIENLFQHININEVFYYLGENYFLTNLLPLKLINPNLSSNKSTDSYYKKNLINDNLINNSSSDDLKSEYIFKDSNIDFLISGFKNDFIYNLLNIFYNLSITVDNFFFAPCILPLIISTNNSKIPIVIVSKDYTLLYSEYLVKFIPFGTNLIFEKIAKKTNIPYELLIKYSYNIEQELLSTDSPLFYRIDEFVINDIKKIAFNSLKEYIEELQSLIIDKFLYKHDTIIIISAMLKIFKDHGLLSFADSLSIDFYDKYYNIYHNKETFITDWINQGAFQYFTQNYKKDFALLNFKKQAVKLVKAYGNINI